MLEARVTTESREVCPGGSAGPLPRLLQLENLTCLSTKSSLRGSSGAQPPLEKTCSVFGRPDPIRNAPGEALRSATSDDGGPPIVPGIVVLDCSGVHPRLVQDVVLRELADALLDAGDAPREEDC